MVGHSAQTSPSSYKRWERSFNLERGRVRLIVLVAKIDAYAYVLSHCVASSARDVPRTSAIRIPAMAFWRASCLAAFGLAFAVVSAQLDTGYTREELEALTKHRQQHRHSYRVDVERAMCFARTCHGCRGVHSMGNCVLQHLCRTAKLIPVALTRRTLRGCRGDLGATWSLRPSVCALHMMDAMGCEASIYGGCR